MVSERACTRDCALASEEVAKAWTEWAVSVARCLFKAKHELNDIQE